jgi:uncharacterized membrane protein YqjE
VFFVLAMFIAIVLRIKILYKSKLFSASIAELAKDREQLGASHE